MRMMGRAYYCDAIPAFLHNSKVTTLNQTILSKRVVEIPNYAFQKIASSLIHQSILLSIHPQLCIVVANFARKSSIEVHSTSRDNEQQIEDNGRPFNGIKT